MISRKLITWHCYLCTSG